MKDILIEFFTKTGIIFWLFIVILGLYKLLELIFKIND